MKKGFGDFLDLYIYLKDILYYVFGFFKYNKNGWWCKLKKGLKIFKLGRRKWFKWVLLVIIGYS